jgi:F-type H+-transporting ATPase subunit b
MDVVAKAIQEFIDAALGVSAKEMGIQIAATLLLFLVVRFFFWNHVTDFIEGRKKLISSEIKEAQHLKEEASEMKSNAQDELVKVRNNARDIIENAKQKGQQERTEIIAKAKEEASKMIDNAEKEIDGEVRKARKQMNDEIVSVAVLMAEKIVKKELDEQTYNDMIEEVTKGVAS